jgi:hypothetical protein
VSDGGQKILSLDIVGRPPMNRGRAAVVCLASSAQRYSRCDGKSARRIGLRSYFETSSPRSSMPVKVAVAWKRAGAWVVAAESCLEPRVSAHSPGGLHPFDRMSAPPRHRVELWRASDRDWTLVAVASPPNAPVILILDGDWTACALVLRDLAQRVSLEELRTLHQRKHFTPSRDACACRYVRPRRGRHLASRRSGCTERNGVARSRVS